MDIIFILVTFLRVYQMVLFMRIILSWVPMDHDHKIVIFLVKVTDPVLLPVREVYMRIMDRFNIQMPMDFSPIIVFVLLGFLERTLASFY